MGASGPKGPKPRDKAAGHRSRAELEGRSTTVVLSAEPTVDWLDSWSGRTVEVERADGELATIPAPHGRWLKQTKQRWEAFWTAAEAQMVRPHHMASVERLFQLYDEEERLRRRVARRTPVGQMVPLGLDGPARDGEQVVEHDYRAQDVPGHLGVGSQGQLVESADWKALVKIRQEIRQLEDRFAGTPMAEFRLGWQQAEMKNAQARAREARELGSVAAELRQSHGQQ